MPGISDIRAALPPGSRLIEDADGRVTRYTLVAPEGFEWRANGGTEIVCDVVTVKAAGQHFAAWRDEAVGAALEDIRAGLDPA